MFTAFCLGNLCSVIHF